MIVYQRNERFSHESRHGLTRRTPSLPTLHGPKSMEEFCAHLAATWSVMSRTAQ
jgi:hypothetical protein